tara:strand:+ start:2059 stop:3057 length:999 start_codon:yes stop_codon:yes gene_type:complete
MSKFKAIYAQEIENDLSINLTEIGFNDLPQEEVLVEVAYSGLNYKDGLALNGNKGKVLRKFPMVPGIDFSGTVVESKSNSFVRGDKVLATGFGLGEKWFGGYSRYTRVKADWLVPLPDKLDLMHVMAIGTAGFTAMLAVIELEKKGLIADNNSVLVTGAGGGLGSIAVAILSKLGYNVSVSSGRPELKNYLLNLGAKEFVARDSLDRDSKLIESSSWQAAIDTVGGKTLATVISQISPNGSVAVCGNAGGNSLQTNVLPFLLRGVSLLGIDSVNCNLDLRKVAWQRLSDILDSNTIESFTRIIPLSNLIEESKKILEGKIKGRTVVSVSEED